MLKAKNYSLAGSDQEASGDVLVIFDAKGNPVVMAVAISPSLTKFYTLEKPEEFGRALQQYGVSLPADISDLRL